MQTYVHPTFRVVASFVPNGAKSFSIGFVKADLESCMPLNTTLNAVQTYKHEKLDKYDLILINGLEIKPNEIEAELPELLPSQRSICILTKGELPTANWRPILSEHNYQVNSKLTLPDDFFVYQFSPIKSELSSTKEVLVLSNYLLGNFADRTGYHLLNPLLPAHANVTHCSLSDRKIPNKEFDLVILGFGNCLHQDHLTPELIHLLENAKKAIGIFGTQYRQNIINQDMERILGNLDYWFARSTEDLYIYGKYAQNKMCLGDWSIHLANMTEGFKEKRLEINNVILNNYPLDRSIQRIQEYKNVLSRHAQPLLIASTSAEQLEYSEQFLKGSVPSEKFRSILIDIYGFAPPENLPFMNNKVRVQEYKQFVAANIPEVQKVINECLS